MPGRTGDLHLLRAGIDMVFHRADGASAPAAPLVATRPSGPRRCSSRTRRMARWTSPAGPRPTDGGRTRRRPTRHPSRFQPNQSGVAEVDETWPGVDQHWLGIYRIWLCNNLARVRPISTTLGQIQPANRECLAELGQIWTTYFGLLRAVKRPSLFVPLFCFFVNMTKSGRSRQASHDNTHEQMKHDISQDLPPL